MLLHYYLVQFSFTKKRKYSTVSNTQTQHNSTVSTTVPVIFIPLAISQTQEHLLKNKIAYLPLLITILSPPIPLSPACLLPLTHLLPRLYPPSHSTTIAAPQPPRPPAVFELLLYSTFNFSPCLINIHRKIYTAGPQFLLSS